MRFALCFAFAAALSGSFSCKAQVQANAEVNAKGGEVEDFNKPLDHPVGEGASPFDGASSGNALLGARPDLSFKGPLTATCKCLAVAVGQPGDASFNWSGEKPRTDPDSQLVIAMTANGISCPDAGASTLGASYWGYEVQRDDVIVVVEPAGAGRPLTTGAIIPRPLGDGHVYVRPVGKSVPYGRPTSGGGAMCALGPLSKVASKPTPAIPPSAGAAAPRTGKKIGGDEAPPDTAEVSMP